MTGAGAEGAALADEASEYDIEHELEISELEEASEASVVDIVSDAMVAGDETDFEFEVVSE